MLYHNISLSKLLEFCLLNVTKLLIFLQLTKSSYEKAAPPPDPSASNAIRNRLKIALTKRYKKSPWWANDTKRVPDELSL